MQNIIALPIPFWVFLVVGCASTEGIKDQTAQQAVEVANEISEIEVSVDNVNSTFTQKLPSSEVEQLQSNIVLPSIVDHQIAEKHLVQIGRYSAVHPVPTEEQQDILKVIINVTLPEEIDTTGQAVRYLLKRSGYQLVLPEAQDPEVLQLLAKKLPQIHRKLGPMTLENALLTLTAPAFRLQKDPVHRLILEKSVENRVIIEST